MGPARARLLTKVIWAGASRWCGFGGWGSPGRCYCRTPALLWRGGRWGALATAIWAAAMCLEQAAPPWCGFLGGSPMRPAGAVLLPCASL
jgi:hypothetical protein